MNNNPYGFEQTANASFLKPMPHNAFHKAALHAYIELLRLKNYSPNTLKNYTNWFLVFLEQFPHRKPSTITKSEIMDFMVRFRNKPNWSATSQNQLINAVHPVGLKK